MPTFYCHICDADLIDYPMSPSVDENGAEFTTTARESHMTMHLMLGAAARRIAD